MFAFALVRAISPSRNQSCMQFPALGGKRAVRARVRVRVRVRVSRKDKIKNRNSFFAG